MRSYCFELTWFLIACAVTLTFSSSAEAQRMSRLPDPRDYNENVFFRVYYEAEYADARKIFNRGANTAFKTTNGKSVRRYLDSIVYWTMLGECYYHMGNYAEAIELYERSLSLYLSYQTENWQARIELPATIPTNNNAYSRARITWGTPSRTGKVANVPTAFKVMFGRVDAGRAYNEGGLVDNAELKMVDVTEIMRCVSLCIHRRTTINGPIGKFDPFNSQLVSGLSTGGAGGIVATYNGVLKGLALASSGEFDRAKSLLNQSLQFKGMDHALTPVALLEIAKIGLATDRLAAAKGVALEASYSAAIFNQYDLVEESLSLATTIHLMSARTEFPPLRPAIQWAKANRARLMEASLSVRLAECFAEAGDAASATAALRMSKSPMSSRNSLSKAVVSARAKYVDAVIQFLNGNFRGGSASLAKALNHFQTGSVWLYRLRLANNLIVANKINQRQADQLYTAILRDPTELDWKTDPMESIAFLASAHVGPMQLWFDIAADRKDHQRALEIGDMVRRHRFFSNLPLGGRLMAFRWVMHSPVEALSSPAMKQRANFMNRNPKYRQSIARAEAIRKELLTIPVAPEARSEEGVKQVKLIKELATISEIQEAILASYALRREPAEMIFPPQRNFTEFQQTIKKDQLALVTLATTAGYHVYLVSADRLQYVGLLNGKGVARGVGGMLKSLGVGGPAVGYKDLTEGEWEEDALKIKKSLFGADDSAWDRYTELVIVPDGAFWYFPFEALPVKVAKKADQGDEDFGADADEDDEESKDEDENKDALADADVDPENKNDDDAETDKYLSDIIDIRYSPTLFMAFGTQRPVQPVNRSVVVTARMHSRGDAELSNKEYSELIVKMPDAMQLEGQLRVPSNYLGVAVDQLVVWSDIKSVRSPLAMMPMQIDKDKNSNSISNWMSLPWRGPEHVVMPGFNSDGGSGMRNDANGGDLFLTTLGMLASGTRTTLISRWATGGKTSLQLTGEYAAALAKDGPVKAIHNSRRLTRTLDVDFENEPRVRVKKTDPSIKAEHPFFWASHMLIAVPVDKNNPQAVVSEDKLADVDGAAVEKDGDGEKDKAGKMEAEKSDAEESEEKTEGKSSEKTVEEILNDAKLKAEELKKKSEAAKKKESGSPKSDSSQSSKAKSGESKTEKQKQ
ncbi:MAG: tetratricopeptide repeat protein [Mariniblastus sp.]